MGCREIFHEPKASKMSRSISRVQVKLFIYLFHTCLCACSVEHKIVSSMGNYFLLCVIENYTGIISSTELNTCAQISMDIQLCVCLFSINYYYIIIVVVFYCLFRMCSFDHVWFIYTYSDFYLEKLGLGGGGGGGQDVHTHIFRLHPLLLSLCVYHIVLTYDSMVSCGIRD